MEVNDKEMCVWCACENDGYGVSGRRISSFWEIHRTIATLKYPRDPVKSPPSVPTSPDPLCPMRQTPNIRVSKQEDGSISYAYMTDRTTYHQITGRCSQFYVLDQAKIIIQ